jgi:hypothetical protein
MAMEFYIVLLVSWSYSFYAVAFSGRRPAKKYYQKILQPANYFWHLAGASMLSMGAYYLAKWKSEFYIVLFSPLFFLLVLQLCNGITRAMYGRNVILLYRGDVKPKEFKWYVDGMLSIVCLVAPIVFPALFINYFRHFHEIKIGVTN